MKNSATCAFSFTIIMILLNADTSIAAPIGTCLEVRNVERWDFLFIRERPNHRSKKTGAIAPNTQSPLVITGKCIPNTQNLKRLWCPVEYYIASDIIKRGFVKMYFTKETPCPPSLEFFQQKG